MPFDIFEPWCLYNSREARNAVEIVVREDGIFKHDTRDDSFERQSDDIHLGGSSGAANEERKVFTKEDVDRALEIIPAEEQLRNGTLDYLKAGIKKFGHKYFVMGGGIVNSFWGCTFYVGLTNRFVMYLDEPEFIEYLSERYLAANLERIRAIASTGADAMWIDDATASSEMISLDMYTRFSLPYLKPLVKEIQKQGMKCILVYFGGVSDRVEHILSTEPDALIVETSMKSYVNDIGKIAGQINGRTCLFGNLNPYDDVEKLSEDALYAKMTAQFEAVRPYRRFVTSTGSPLTPGTPVARIRRYIEMGHQLA